MRGSVFCPKADAVLDFEVPYTEAKLPDVWDATFEVECPLCGGAHEVGCAEAYKQGVMSLFEYPIEAATKVH